MTEKSDSERLAEIEKINRPFLKITGLGYEIEWLISSLRLAWAQNERLISEYEMLRTRYIDSTAELMISERALKRCEELKGGE